MGLSDYLANKGKAMRHAAAKYSLESDWLETISADCTSDDLTGVRKLRIQDWQYVGDSGEAFGGWGLGPSSPELFCGVLSTCFCHTYLIGASWFEIKLESIHVHVEAQNNDAWFVDIDQDAPKIPFNFRIVVDIEGPKAGAKERAELSAFAEASCPILAIVKSVTEIEIVTHWV